MNNSRNFDKFLSRSFLFIFKGGLTHLSRSKQTCYNKHNMRGITQKILGSLLLLSLLFSVGHFCIENSNAAPSKTEISDTPQAPSDSAPQASQHHCHLGCCPAVNYNSMDIELRFDVSTVKLEEIPFFASPSLSSLFKPPIA